MSGWPDSLPGHLDQPADGAVLPAAPAWIRGWTPWFDGGVARVVVRVDGRRVGLARIGCARPDVAALTDHPFAPICGFELMLDMGDVGVGRARIEVTAEASGGQTRPMGAVEVTVADEPPVSPGPGRPAPRTAPGSRPLRVAAATNVFEIGGATTFFTDLVTRLHGNGFDVRAASFVDGPHGERLRAAGVETTLLDAPPVHDEAAYEAWLAEATVWLGDADVMLPNTLATFALADLATGRGIPTVWPVHEPVGMRAFWEIGYGGGMHPQVRARAEDAFRHASGVTVAAASVADLFRPFASRGRVHVVPYGIDPDGLRAAAPLVDRVVNRGAEGIPEDAALLVCLGTVEERKGQAVLTQAFRSRADHHGDAVLALVGARERDPLVGALREHLRRAGDADRVRIVPVVTDPGYWLAMADLVVCASDFEVIPLAVLDAMALGIPVLSTRVFGLTDVVREGETGFLCRPCDVDDLAAALDRALSQRARWPEMGRRSAELIRSRHAMEPAVDAHADLLRRAAAGP